MNEPESSSQPSGAPNASDLAGQSLVEQDEIDVRVLGIVGVLIAVVVVLIAVLLQAWFYHGKGDLTAARTVPANSPGTSLGRALLEQREQINTYRWVNRDAQIPAVPIERAMELVVKEMAREQEQAKP
jgi:hypothetical protein